MQPDNIQNLADDLEKNLKEKNSFKSLDFRGEKVVKDKGPETLEIEKEIQKVKAKDYQSEYIKKPQENNLEKEYQAELQQQKEIDLQKKNRVIQKFISAKEKFSRNKTNESPFEFSTPKNLAHPSKKYSAFHGAGEKDYLKPTASESLALIRRPIIYLIAIEMFIYFFSIFSFAKNILLNIFLPLVLVLDVFVFVWLYLRLVEKENLPIFSTSKLLILTGFLVGFGRAIFKIIWLTENWTLINLIIESFLTAFIAGMLALIISVFFKKKFATSSTF